MLSRLIIGEGNGNPLQCSCLDGEVEPGGLPSMGSHRVGHDGSGLAAAALLKYPARVKAGSLKCTVLCN